MAEIQGRLHSASGNILNKELQADLLLNGAKSTLDIDFDYTFNTTQPHTIQEIYDNESSSNISFEWDNSGNMTYVENQIDGYTRQLCWDEENRLSGVADDDYLSIYLYNAGGSQYPAFGNFCFKTSCMAARESLITKKAQYSGRY